MATQTPKVPDAALLAKLQRCLWRDEARRKGVAEADIERSVWTKWRIEGSGGPAVVAWELGQMRPAPDPST